MLLDYKMLKLTFDNICAKYIKPRSNYPDLELRAITSEGEL